MPRAHGGHVLPRRRRLLPLAAAAALVLLMLFIVLPTAPPAEPASLLRAAMAAHPSPAAYARPCADHLALSLHRLRAALSALESGGDLPAAVHLASASLQYQYDCSHLLSLPAFPSHRLTSRFLNSLAPQTLTAGPKPSSASASASAAAAFPTRIRPAATVCKPSPAAKPCDYSTVQAAVNGAPNHTAGHFVITVAAGIYKENVIIPYEKTNILLVGEGMGATVITASQSVEIDGLGTYDTATVAVIGDGFRARDITFENSAESGAHQAVAFRSDSHRSVLENVEFRGHQDTLYARTMRHLYR